ncbi:MAG: hypothetical protein V4655_08255 [Bdellovibrionota bacterium]|nr:MAG: hypothetical protein EOP10_21035 [Pseudomonadota bacterium]
MDLKEKAKKVGRILGIGAIWVYVLSIPYGDRLLFDHAYDVLVDNKVVHTITREVKSGIKHAKSEARRALDDGETEVAKANREVDDAQTQF